MIRFPINFKQVLTFITLSAGLIFLSLHFEVDGYREPFVSAASFTSWLDLFAVTLRDPGYSFLQNIFARFVSFEIFAAGCIVVALGIKFSALLSIHQKPSLLNIVPYVLLMSFLHESIQIRAAIALSIAFWSFLLFIRQRKLVAYGLLLMAGSFHVSALVFGLVYLLVELYERYQQKLFYFCLSLVLGLSFLPFLPDALMKIGYLLNSRHISYIGQVNQNKTGLFAYYYLYVGALTFLVWYFHKPKDHFWIDFHRLAITSGCTALAVMFIFHFSVNIASRLADVLFFPVVIVMGALLVQLKNEKRYFFLSFLILSFLSYGLLRGVVSFQPELYLNIKELVL